MTFEEVLELVLDGMRLGILDDINIDYEGKNVSFYYGGLKSYGDGCNLRSIWFENSKTIKSYYRNTLAELKRKVRKARKDAIK